MDRGDVKSIFIFYPQLLGAAALGVGIWGLVSCSVWLIVWGTLLHCHMSHDHM